MQEYKFDLQLMDLFEEGVGRKQVLPKREFIFDLSNIMRDFKDLENCGGDKMKRSQIIHQVSYRLRVTLIDQCF
jgi:hypothetical protein